mgnify:CR=1 FL=1
MTFLLVALPGFDVTLSTPVKDPKPADLINVMSVLSQTAATRRLMPIAKPVERLLSFDRINSGYREVLSLWEEEGSFFKACLRVVGATYQVSNEDLDRFPQKGPVLVVSNHPFGALDGIILGAILEEVRPDFRLLGNFLLQQVEPLKSWIIPVSPFDSARNSSDNSRGLRACLGWLKEGGVLATFPAGEVAHFNFRQRSVRDPEWSKHAISLARRGGAVIVPFFVHGRNSLVFQSLGKLHPLLRTAMLGRELANKAGHEIPVAIGKPIPSAKLDRLNNDLERTRYVRMRTEILANRVSEPETGRSLIPAKPPKMEPIIDPIDPEVLAEEIAGLPSENRIYDYKHFALYFCRSAEIPNVLREIGRLREVTFRQEGEGSGKSCDLDQFDQHYRHLFLWDSQANKIAGSYRCGMTDEIIPKYGKRGLYTSTLFHLSDEFIDALTPGLELGRSFVAPDYQRTQQTLTLLWRGVGVIPCREPKYYRLFGPVSISNTYSKASKALITKYLREGRDEDLNLAARVRPRRPFRHRRRILGLEGKEVSGLLNGVEDVSALISEIEIDRKGIPVLLKHYLRMHTTLMSFNVDREFSNCLDGLIITDLKKSDRKFLSRFFSEEGLDAIAAYQP